MTTDDTPETGPRIRLYVTNTSRVPCVRAELVTNYHGCMDFEHFLKRQKFQEAGIEYASHEERIDQFNFFPQTGRSLATLLGALQEFRINDKAILLVGRNENPIDSNDLCRQYESAQVGRATRGASIAGRS